MFDGPPVSCIKIYSHNIYKKSRIQTWRWYLSLHRNVHFSIPLSCKYNFISNCNNKMQLTEPGRVRGCVCCSVSQLRASSLNYEIRTRARRTLGCRTPSPTNPPRTRGNLSPPKTHVPRALLSQITLWTLYVCVSFFLFHSFPLSFPSVHIAHNIFFLIILTTK